MPLRFWFKHQSIEAFEHATRALLANGEYRAMNQALEQAGLPEAPGSQLGIGFAVVRLRVLCQEVQVDEWPVPNGKSCHGQGSESCIVESCSDAVQQSLARKAAEDLVEEEHEGEADIFVEGVFDEASQAVRGQAAMHQQQPEQKPAHSREPQ